MSCLLYTSDAADDLLCVDLGGRRIIKKNKVSFKSNNSGGSLGGITSGQDIVIKFAVKPTSSILTKKKTIDVDGENTDIRTKGRHDPCVGIRAVPVGEAMLSCVLLDHYLLHKAQCS